MYCHEYILLFVKCPDQNERAPSYKLRKIFNGYWTSYYHSTNRVDMPHRGWRNPFRISFDRIWRTLLSFAVEPRKHPHGIYRGRREGCSTLYTICPFQSFTDFQEFVQEKFRKLCVGCVGLVRCRSVRIVQAGASSFRPKCDRNEALTDKGVPISAWISVVAFSIETPIYSVRMVAEQIVNDVIGVHCPGKRQAWSKIRGLSRWRG